MNDDDILRSQQLFQKIMASAHVQFGDGFDVGRLPLLAENFNVIKEPASETNSNSDQETCGVRKCGSGMNDSHQISCSPIVISSYNTAPDESRVIEISGGHQTETDL